MTLNIEPACRSIGAFVHDMDLENLQNPKEIKEIKALFAIHQVLIFRNQRLSHQGLVKTAKIFGSPTTNDDLRPATIKDFPEITTAETKEGNRAGADVWHSDQTHRQPLIKATLLYGKSIPKIGGDTLVSNMYQLFETLSEPMKEFLRKLHCIHSEAKAFGDEFEGIQNSCRKFGIEPDKVFAHKEDVIQPLVLKHPETTRECLFYSYPYVKRIVELPKKESDLILGFINQHIQNPNFVYRHRWQENDLIIWDNRCTQHMGVSDYYPDPRMIYKVTTC